MTSSTNSPADVERCECGALRDENHDNLMPGCIRSIRAAVLRRAHAKVAQAEQALLEAKAEEQSALAIVEGWKPATRPDAIDWSPEPATTSWNSETGYNTDRYPHEAAEQQEHDENGPRYGKD